MEYRRGRMTYLYHGWGVAPPNEVLALVSRISFYGVLVFTLRTVRVATLLPADHADGLAFFISSGYTVCNPVTLFGGQLSFGVVPLNRVNKGDAGK